MLRTVKNISIIIFSIALLFGLVACGPQTETTSSNDQASTASSPSASPSSDAGDETEEIKIGLVLAETGPASTLGLSEVQTMRLLQEQLDAEGPINGKTIKLLLQDYETDDTKAIIAMDRLLSEGVVAVVGATQVSTTAAILPHAVEAGIPLVTVAPADTKNENVFVTTPSSLTVAEVILDWLNERNIKRVGWINASDAFGVEGLPFFETLIEGTDIEIVAHEEFDASATDMTVQLTKIKGQNPEVVIVWSRTPGAGVVARNFKALDFGIPMIQSTASANQGFLDQVKDDNEDIYVVGSKMSVVDELPDSEQKQRLKAYVDAFQAKFDATPDLFAAHTHDAISMLVQAIRAGYTDPADITNYLTNEMGEYPGMTGTFNYAVDRSTSLPDGLAILGIKDNQWTLSE